MRRSEPKLDCGTLAAVQKQFAEAVPALHRIRTVRRQQGISMKGLSRKTGERVYELERDELPGTDLLLSRLHCWQQWLAVPVSDLLTEPDAGLSPRVLERARLIRVMKTVRALGEEVQDVTSRRLIATMESQLLQIMPELDEIAPWNSIGQRRTLDELGRVEERTIVLRDWIGE